MPLAWESYGRLGVESVACMRQLAWDAAGVHNRGVLKSAALLYSEWRLKLERILILETTDVALSCLGRSAPRTGGRRPRAGGGGSGSRTESSVDAQQTSSGVFVSRPRTGESGAFEENEGSGNSGMQAASHVGGEDASGSSGSRTGSSGLQASGEVLECRPETGGGDSPDSGSVSECRPQTGGDDARGSGLESRPQTGGGNAFVSGSDVFTERPCTG